MRTVRLRQVGWMGMCALVIAGCTIAKATGGSDSGSNFDNLEVVDSGLNAKVAILRVGSALADNNLLSVFAGLKNKTAHRLALEVETIYKDSAGNALNAGSWISMTLKPNEERDYRSSAISEQAVDFLIRVRCAPPSTVHTRG